MCACTWANTDQANDSATPLGNKKHFSVLDWWLKKKHGGRYLTEC